MSGLTKVLSMIHNPQLLDIVDAFKFPLTYHATCYNAISYPYKALLNLINLNKLVLQEHC